MCRVIKNKTTILHNSIFDILRACVCSCVCVWGGGEGGLRVQGLWRKVRWICPRFLFLFSEVEISSRTPVPLFRLGSVHGGSSGWDDCGRAFPEKFVRVHYPGEFPHYAWTSQSVHCYFVGSRMSANLDWVHCHLTFGRTTRVFYVLLLVET